MGVFFYSHCLMATPPLNSFFLFCKDYRSIYAVANPQLTNADVTSLLAKNWRNLDPKMKSLFKDRAKRLRNEYKSSNVKPKDKKAKMKELSFSFKVESLNIPKVNLESKSRTKKIQFVDPTYKPSKIDFIPYQQPNQMEHHTSNQSINQNREYVSYNYTPCQTRIRPSTSIYQEPNMYQPQVTRHSSYNYPYGPEHEWYYNLNF